jgi:hypothetical protein
MIWQVVLAATHLDTHIALAEAAQGPSAPSDDLRLFGAKLLAKITSRQVHARDSVISGDDGSGGGDDRNDVAT